LQQKISFEDTAGAIPRRMPFSIDLDAQLIVWSEDERTLVADDPELAWLAGEMPGATHCRPDGGDQGTWVKHGWAFNQAEARPTMAPSLSETFPEIVLRGAARLNPSLKVYYGRLPRNMHHYGGYYTMTDENWPLIGKMAIEGAFVAGAMSGFGAMAACAAGELCARWSVGCDLPHYALALSPERYADHEMMAQIEALASRGIL
jgi:glycine/D-amino acid oxidase-like deaminating enzyme